MKVCIVSHSATGLTTRPSGGSELQSALLATGLSARGHDVTFVVPGLTGEERTVSGVRLRSGWDPDRGVRFVRALTYRYPHLRRVLRATGADVYYARGLGYFTPFVVGAARALDAVSVLGLASDRDLYPDSASALFHIGDAPLPPAVAMLLHKAYMGWTFNAATWMAVQNDEQAEACVRRGLRSAFIPNIVADPPIGLVDVEPRRDVIWAGNVTAGRRSKGVGELAALAASLPGVSFTVVGRLDAPEHREAIARLSRAANVDMTGPLSRDDTERCIAEHRLVVNTSPSEGFSNVMLEGWSLGRPSVTLAVDPSGLLGVGRLGICAAGDLVTMAAAVAALLEEAQARAAMGRRARAYVRETHSADSVCERFERLVRDPDCDARPEPLVPWS